MIETILTYVLCLGGIAACAVTILAILVVTGIEMYDAMSAKTREWVAGLVAGFAMTGATVYMFTL